MKRKRGRPPVFFGERLAHIKGLIQALGYTQTRNRLAAEGISITMPTLIGIGQGMGLRFQRGRPKVNV